MFDLNLNFVSYKNLVMTVRIWGKDLKTVSTYNVFIERLSCHISKGV